MSLGHILRSLKPNANFATDGDKIYWNDEIETQPTDEEIEAERQRLKLLEPITKIRKQRNRLLLETDFYGLSDFQFPDEANKTAWLNYRHALRDLPSNIVVDDEGNLIEAVFPIKPSSRK